METVAKTATKRKKKRWSVAESTLLTLWREKVKRIRGNRCARCGNTPVECHHAVHRSRKVLAWDYRNGIPLCAECHLWAHTLEGSEWVLDQLDREYLTAMDRFDLSQWCAQNGITKDEFRQQKKAELKE